MNVDNEYLRVLIMIVFIRNVPTYSDKQASWRVTLKDSGGHFLFGLTTFSIKDVSDGFNTFTLLFFFISFVSVGKKGIQIYISNIEYLCILPITLPPP